MRVVCVGGGPAGLYFAILMKLRDAGHEVTVLERKPAGSPDGWGVVFWDDLVDDVRATDPETARRVGEAAFRWRGQSLDLQGERTDYQGSGYGIGRSKLLELLAARAIELGVDIRLDRDVNNADEFSDADLVVAADGANSVLRQLASQAFGTDVVVGRNKYVWLGTTKIFDPFTFAFVKTDSGWIWCHAYAFDSHTSTFIVECSPEVWTELGFGTLDARDSIRVLEDIFAKQLEGTPLEYRRRDDASLGWLNFRTITNACWHSGNTVLMGDAAHTTHFSIGSGMRLAMQDAIALAGALDTEPTRQLAFASYERGRRAALLRPQTEARFSAAWFENVTRYVDLPSPAFFVLLRARRDPLLPRVPPKAYYRFYAAVERVGFPRSLRAWIGPKARALYGRFGVPGPRPRPWVRDPQRGRERVSRWP